MIAILLLLIPYLVATAVTFRYTGYRVNEKLLTNGHTYDSICKRCKCNNCGRARYGHWQHERAWRMSGCKVTQSDDNEWHGMHPTAALLGMILAVLWPGLLTWYAMSSVKKSLGLEIQYFKPPPEIRSREERRVAREEATKARVAELEKRNAELEKEMGIGC